MAKKNTNKKAELPMAEVLWKDKGFSLIPSKYIELVNRDESVDYDIKMKELQSELAANFKTEAESRAAVLDVFKSIGYEIKL